MSKREFVLRLVGLFVMFTHVITFALGFICILMWSTPTLNLWVMGFFMVISGMGGIAFYAQYLEYKKMHDDAKRFADKLALRFGNMTAQDIYDSMRNEEDEEIDGIRGEIESMFPENQPRITWREKLHDLIMQGRWMDAVNNILNNKKERD